MTPARASRLRILDPACGSGSFLLGAYQYLLDWHRDQYVKAGPEKHRKELYEGPGGEWRLTTQEKKRILLNNIYGVDIDAQAVEVTKLSLLLKVLEGESDQTISLQQKMFRERALPDLSSNIKCGNSLIGSDFWQGEQQTMFDDEEERLRINAFDWEHEFPEIMKSGLSAGGHAQAGGFDAVIGNPPYIRVQALNEWSPESLPYFKKHYRSAAKGNYDIYVVFAEKGLSLLNKTGLLGYILPHKFFNSQYGEPLRSLIVDGKHLKHVVHFGHIQVFSGATTYTCLLFLGRPPSHSVSVVKPGDLGSWLTKGTAESGTVDAEASLSGEWSFAVGKGARLAGSLRSMTPKLGEVADVFVGLQTSADDVYILDVVAKTSGAVRLHSKALSTDVMLEPGALHPLVSGTDIGRYRVLPWRQYILFPYEVADPSATLMQFDALKRRFPMTATYLDQNKERLERREGGKFRGTGWYRFGRSQNLGIQGRAKICVPRLVERLRATVDITGSHYLDNVDVGGVTLKPGHDSMGLLYLLGLLNSRLLAWYFPHISAPFRGGWMSANRQFLAKLPIRTIDFSDKKDKARHDRMVELVERMLELHKRLPKAKGESKTGIERQIAATDKAIDALVYELYGLTAEEVRTVEGGTEQ
ncbi:MAG: Eco57I restriction-modification methylase domain-containing protein [bacterium]